MLSTLTDIQADKDIQLIQVNTHLIIEITECISSGRMSRTLIKKSESDVSISTLNFPDSESEIAVPYETYVQVIYGTANLILNGSPMEMLAGDSVVIPAFVKHKYTCNNEFKLIATILKSGY
jgi:hypothetical protein